MEKRNGIQHARYSEIWQPRFSLSSPSLVLILEANVCVYVFRNELQREKRREKKKQDSSVSGRKRAHAHKRQPKRKNDDENVARFLKKIMPIFVSEKKWRSSPHYTVPSSTIYSFLFVKLATSFKQSSHPYDLASYYGS